MTLQKVDAVRDDSGHWYVIPSELRPLWSELNEAADSDNKNVANAAVDKIIDTFDKYRTGGDLNNIQLYADLKTNQEG